MEYLLGNKDLLSLAYLFRRLYKKFAALMRIEWVPVHSILSVFLLCLYVAQLKRRRRRTLTVSNGSGGIRGGESGLGSLCVM